MEKHNVYFVTLPNDIEKDCVNILILTSQLPVAIKTYALKEYDKSAIDWEAFRWTFSAYGYCVVCDENLENLQKYLFRERDKILSDFRKYGRNPPESYATKFDIVDINKMEAVCRIDLDHNQIISLETINDNTYQLPPYAEINVKTKYLKELAVHLIQIIKGYDSEYAIPVDIAYMLYEIIKNDQERSKQCTQ